ncbi:hypothetical protein [Alloyangia pacifica]|uniref:hypothetical protein n=1 Tax=Alloyangia pacifica TaxID=311180 RepID=UPI001CFEF78D|nr:hypothetical protein [Alloyangia pacifica]
MQVLLQPLREAPQANSEYARERAAAEAEVAALKRARRRHVLGTPLRALRKLALRFGKTPIRALRFNR